MRACVKVLLLPAFNDPYWSALERSKSGHTTRALNKHFSKYFSEITQNTRSVEALRKIYNKEFFNMSSKSSACSNCGAVTKSIVFYRSRFIYEGLKIDVVTEENDLNTSNAARKQRKMGEREKTELKPDELKAHLR